LYGISGFSLEYTGGDLGIGSTSEISSPSDDALVTTTEPVLFSTAMVPLTTPLTTQVSTSTVSSEPVSAANVSEIAPTGKLPTSINFDTAPVTTTTVRPEPSTSQGRLTTVLFPQSKLDFAELSLDNGRLRAKLHHVNDSLHVGLGDLQFQLSNVSGLLNKVATFTNNTQLGLTNITQNLGKFAEYVNTTALFEQLEVIKGYLRSTEVMQVVVICSTLSFFVGAGMMALAVCRKLFGRVSYPSFASLCFIFIVVLFRKTW
jgi:hypothetical protein